MKFIACSLLVLGGLSVATAQSSDSAFLRELNQHFASWDANHNGQLELVEIDKVIASAAVNGDAAAAATSARRGLRTLKQPALTLEMVTKAVEKRTSDKKAEPDFDGNYAWARDRLAKSKRELFLSDPPKVETLTQGKLGDCFCLAALRTMLHRDPRAIKGMITPKGDGFEVRIGAKIVKTPMPTDAEIIIGASTSDGLWPVVYEKAVGLSRRKKEATDETAFNVVTRGGSAGSMMSALTDHEIQRWSCKTWKDASADPAKQKALMDDLRAQLMSAQREQRLITGGTNRLAKGQTGVPGITYGHGYAVLGYDETADVIRVWNPHNNAFTPKGEPGVKHGYPMAKGVMQVPLTEIVTFFAGFAFEQLPKTK